MKIDVVIPWVDGQDLAWQKKKAKFTTKAVTGEKDFTSSVRYRNYDTLRYLLRSIEENMSWVNHVFLVTDNQIPNWLSLKNDKITVVDHTDFISSDWLPTFNSNAIILNAYRIEGLSERFILMNDDMLFNMPVSEADFFINNLPVDLFNFSVIPSSDTFSHILLNNMAIINRYFDKSKVIRLNWAKLFSFKNGKYLIRTLLALPWSGITGIFNFHVGIPYTKTEFKAFVAENPKEIRQTCSNKFRTNQDINEWVVRYWRLCLGQFVTGKARHKAAYFTINELNRIQKELIKPTAKQICLNDSDVGNQYEANVKQLKQLLERRFPNKSIFEKQ